MKREFGGLNIISGSLSLPEKDSPSLLNVDFDISGAVKKRKGTLTIYKDSATLNPVFVSRFVTILGFEFIISKYDNILRVLDLVDDVSTVVWSKVNVFRDVTLTPFSVPLDDNINLLLCEKHAPIQVRFQEFRQSVVTAGTTIDINVGVEWVNTFVDTIVYVNGKRRTATRAYSAGVLTLTAITLLAGDSVYVCTFSWQWWAEALIWFGDSFYQRVSRFGSSPEDIHVKIPNSIVTDEIPDATRYGVFAYQTDAFGRQYAFKSNNQPQISLDYSFSDGASYTPSAETFTSPSRFFVTFGDITSENERTFSDKDVTANQITILKHKYESFDIISFRNTEGDVPNGTVEGSSYFVKKISDDIIELYSNVALTTIVPLTARNTRAFTDLAVDYTDNFIAITAHGFISGQPIRFTSSGNLPVGLSENTTYYASALNVNAFSIFFDQKLRKKVIFVYRTELFFNATNVSGSILNIPQHNLFTGDAVRVKTTNGTLPATLNATSVYYVLALTAGAIRLYSDSTLLTIVANYTGLVGDIFLYLDGGVHNAVADGLTTTVLRVAYDAVSFIRLRQLRFNGESGLTVANLSVFVDGVLATRNNTLLESAITPSYYTHETESLTPYIGTTTRQKFISFSADTPIGVDKDSLVELINTQTSWCGIAALSSKFNFDNGSYVPAYGFGDYADYLTGVFPTFGALYQNRLCLSGLDTTVLISGVYDRVVEDAPYRYFQITDDLENPLLDPFRIRIPFSQSDSVTAMRQWQQFLFIFTRSEVFKTSLDGNGQFNSSTPSTTLAASVGCISREGVATTESTIYFVSDSGVFDLAVAVQNEYRASEISLPIREIVKKLTRRTKIVYDSFNNKLYIYDERLLVYFTDIKAWTEYRAILPWDITSLVSWRDATILCCKLLCDFQMVKTEYEKYVDFAKRFVGGESVYMQPVISTTPTFASVNRYLCHTPFLPDRSIEDVLVKLNSVALQFGTEWYKLEDNYIYVVSPIVGTLSFTALYDDTFYGVVEILDNVLVPLTNTSLGIANPVSVCAELFVIYYTTMTVNYLDGTTFTATNADYSTRAALVASGTVPANTEVITKTDGNTVLRTTSRATDPTFDAGELRIEAYTTKAFTSWVVNVEAWSSAAPIEISRTSELYARTVGEQFNYTLAGNPSNALRVAALQPNGLFRSNVSISRTFQAGGNAFVVDRLEAFTVPKVSDITLNTGLTVTNWKCISGLCVPDANGVYTSQVACNAALIPPAFTGGQCVNQAYLVFADFLQGGIWQGIVYTGIAMNGRIVSVVITNDTVVFPNALITATSSAGAVVTRNARANVSGQEWRTPAVRLAIYGSSWLNPLGATGQSGAIDDGCGNLPSTCP